MLCVVLIIALITWFLWHLWKGILRLCYNRVSCPHGVRVRLSTSKNHLVPSKALSIPRLELLSCVLLSRLIDSVQKALETDVVLENVCLWSDLQVALQWLKQVNKMWNVWVQNRVGCISGIAWVLMLVLCFDSFQISWFVHQVQLIKII